MFFRSQRGIQGAGDPPLPPRQSRRSLLVSLSTISVQSGWPWAAAPWQAAHVAAKSSSPVREAETLPDVEPCSPGEDEQAITKTGASITIMKEVA